MIRLNHLLAVSRKIGGDLTTMIDHVIRLFNTQQQFLRQAVQSKKPNDQQIWKQSNHNQLKLKRLQV